MHPFDINPPRSNQLEDDPDHGRLVKYPAWIPVRHPFTGQRVNILTPVIDRVISLGEASDMEDWFEMDSVIGTADDYYDREELDNGTE